MQKVNNDTVTEKEDPVAAVAPSRLPPQHHASNNELSMHEFSTESRLRESDKALLTADAADNYAASGNN